MLKSSLIVLLVLSIALPLSAEKREWKAVDKTPLSVLDNDIMPSGTRSSDHGVVITLSPGTRIGTTWFEYQHNSNIGKQIALDSSGEVQFFWTNGLDNGANSRHVFYNCTGLFPDSVGFQIDSDVRSGFITGDVLSNDQAVAAFHTRLTGWLSTDWATAVAVDLIPCLGAFDREIVDTLTLPPAEATTAIWPHMAVDANDNIHVVSSQIEAAAGDPRPIWYNRSTDMGNTFGTWVKVDDSLRSVSYDVQTSRSSGRVSISYTRGVPWNPSQLNEDVYYIESMDYGATWNFPNNSINVTNFTPGDTLRAFVDVSAIYDNNDSLHLAFTLQRVIADTFYWASLIAHWSKETGITIVNSDTLIGWHSQYDAGDFRRMADRPSLGIDPATGYLYCIFTANPFGEMSASGWPNGELFGVSSCDEGLTWGPAVNLTNTPTPGCAPGDCDDDDYPSLAEIVNDTLHIIYINDKDAGAAVRTEGTWTLNPVHYLKVPANTIPCQVGIEEEKGNIIPKSFSLTQNSPNPFGLTTSIAYSLPRKSGVSLAVYDITGREVKTLVNEFKESGVYRVEWDGRNVTGERVPSGIYFYRLKTGEFVQTRKMVVLR